MARKPRKFYKSGPTKSSRSLLLEQSGFHLPTTVNLLACPKLQLIKDKTERDARTKWLKFWRKKDNYLFLAKIPAFVELTFGVPNKIVRSLIKEWVSIYESSICHKGPTYTIQFLKKLHDMSQRYSAGHTFDVLEDHKLCKSKLPMVIKSFNNLLQSKNIQYRRGALFILQLFKLPEIPGPTPLLNSITDDFGDDLGIQKLYIGEFFTKSCKFAKLSLADTNKIVSSFRITLEKAFPLEKRQARIDSICARSTLHLSHKSGPNGACIGSIPADWHALSNDKVLLKAIKDISTLTENDSLLQVIDKFESESVHIENTETNSPPCHSRLSLKVEPGGKTRIFAICDFFSQSAMLGFHKWAYTWLKNQPGDGTMDQNLAKSIVKDWTSLSGRGFGSVQLHSTDLSTATDRIPALFQREIMQQIAGKDFADAWLSLCTNRDFINPISSSVRYTVGQPMGLYSSWAMLAITHHIICRTAMKLSGIKFDKDNPCYVVIGDDCSLIGNEFSSKYHLLMATLLRVPINPRKGFNSETISGINSPIDPDTELQVAEIAKCVFVNGVELTVPTPQAVKYGLGISTDFPLLLSDLITRNCLTSDIGTAPIHLACLSFRPDQALILASSPLAQASLSQIPEWNQIFSEGSVTWNTSAVKLDFIPWYKEGKPIDLLPLDYAMSQELSERTKKVYGSLLEGIKKFLNTTKEDRKSGSWLYKPSEAYTYTVQLLIKILQNMYVASVLFRQPPTTSMPFYERSKDDLKSYKVLFELNNYFEGIPRKQKLDKRRADSRFVSQILLNVTKTKKPLFVTSGSIGNLNFSMNGNDEGIPSKPTFSLSKMLNWN